MKNQEIKLLLLEVAETFKKIAMELGEEKADVKESKQVKDVKDYKETKEVKDEKTEIDFISVRKICAEKAEKGHEEEIREIIKSYGVQTLAKIDSKYYAEILERVEKI